VVGQALLLEPYCASESFNDIDMTHSIGIGIDSCIQLASHAVATQRADDCTAPVSQVQLVADDEQGRQRRP
jgi:hypothetical protein